jgi:acetylornithine deacetylase/succinyl-diaminopimelate desuccinylase-like protein
LSAICGFTNLHATHKKVRYLVLRHKTAIVLALLVTLPTPAFGQARPAAPYTEEMTPDRLRFRALYEEIVETNTTLSSGSCTDAANLIAERLRAAGYPEDDVQIILAPEQENKGNLVAILRGSNPDLKPMLLLAHLDVVEADPEDWERDPFTLFEENNFFYGRGAADDKSMVAIFADSMIRYREEGFQPQRDIKMALTCGEETSFDFNGVRYLLEHHRDLIDAEFALNENGNGILDENGNRVALLLQAGQKVSQTFELEIINPGGHAARPRPDNAISELAAALVNLAAFEFPVDINPATKLYFEGMAAANSGQRAADMLAVAGETPDPAAVERLAKDPFTNALMRTTCIATMLEGGHAANALPQRATATINCRIKPGVSIETIAATLADIGANPDLRITPVGEPGLLSPPPPLNSAIRAPVEIVAARLWPGIPVVPTQMSGADDGRFLNAAGIATYGVSGLFRNPDGDGSHGLNERMPVRSLFEGRDFLYEVVKLYADGD